GDFISRGLSETERAAWDGWVSAGLDAARGALGNAFDEAHGWAPPWHFISGPGPFGAAWRAGAFAPSADKAGRRFLVVAAFEDLTWGEAVALGPRIAAALTDAIYRLLAERLEADPALAVLAAAFPHDDTTAADVLAKLAVPAAEGIWWTAGGEKHAPAIVLGAAPDLVLRALTPLRALP
ncbi:MAG TPA: type VI secretion system-associated protein TagF, partial [Rhizomicrobium sp.]